MRRYLKSLLSFLMVGLVFAGRVYAEVPAGTGEEVEVSPVFTYVVIVLVVLAIVGGIMAKVKAIKNKKEVEEIMQEINNS